MSKFTFKWFSKPEERVANYLVIHAPISLHVMKELSFYFPKDTHLHSYPFLVRGLILIVDLFCLLYKSFISV